MPFIPLFQLSPKDCTFFSTVMPCIPLFDAYIESADLFNLKNKYGSKIVLFCPQTNLEDSKKLGSHAKYCIADGEHVYIGSANITSLGLGKNLELGILTHGNIAKELEQFIFYLIDTNYFIEYK